MSSAYTGAPQETPLTLIPRPEAASVSVHKDGVEQRREDGTLPDSLVNLEGGKGLVVPGD